MENTMPSLCFVRKFVVVSFVSTVLSACGGGGSDSPDLPPVSGSANNIGVIIDSPVINIGYKTETLEGTTNSSGEYEYAEGETVTFYIGDLTFETVEARSTITPFDLAGVTDIDSSAVTNIIRLLQTLDKDNNPSNGITIDDAAKAVATQIDFSLAESDFELAPEVTFLIENGGQDNLATGLVSAEDAKAHFLQQLSSAYYDQDLGASTSSPITIMENSESQPFRSTFADSNAVSKIVFKFSPQETTDYIITRKIIDNTPIDVIPSSTVSIALQSQHLRGCVNGMDEKVQSCTTLLESGTDYYFSVRSFDAERPLFTLLVEKYN